MAIQKSRKDSVVTFRTDRAILTEAEARELVSLVKQEADHISVLIFDLNCVDAIERAALRTLTLALSSVSQNGSKVAVLAQRPVTQFIQDQGLDRLFPCYSTLAGVPLPQIKKPGSNYIRPVF